MTQRTKIPQTTGRQKMIKATIPPNQFLFFIYLYSNKEYNISFLALCKFISFAIQFTMGRAAITAIMRGRAGAIF
jgi:hypothetical protein